MAELKIAEIYRSVQGESSFAGWPCTFVRTAGCDIRCRYCDEPAALRSGDRMPLEQVLERVAALGPGLVEVTGGEPLLQAAVPELVSALIKDDYVVLIETGGHRDISVLDPRCHVILDIKTPGSGMSAHNDLANLERLGPGDEVKVVLCDRADYDWAKALVAEYSLTDQVPVSFSPVHGELDPRELTDWLLHDRIDVRLNLQLHKYIWGPDATSV